MVEENCVKDEESSCILMKDFKDFPGTTSTDDWWSYIIKPETCNNEVKKKKFNINLLNARPDPKRKRYG